VRKRLPFRSMRHTYSALGVRALFQRAAGVGGASTVHSLATVAVGTSSSPHELPLQNDDHEQLVAQQRAEYRAWRVGSPVHHHRPMHRARPIDVLTPRESPPPSAPSRLLTDFDVSSAALMGKGGFGVVVAATSKTDGQRYALKLVPRAGGSHAPPPAETRCLASVPPHPNVVRYHGTWSEVQSVTELRDALAAGAGACAFGDESSEDEGYDEEDEDEEDEGEDEQWTATSTSSCHVDPSARPLTRREAGAASAGALVLQLELMAAPTLHDLLRREMESRHASTPAASAPPQVRWSWLVDVARGLGHLHACGWLHNDVKPANIFCEVGGRAKLCDLGLATPYDRCTAATGRAQYDGTSRRTTPLLSDTSLLSDPFELRINAGTPLYMAPERKKLLLEAPPSVGVTVEEPAAARTVGAAPLRAGTAPVPPVPVGPSSDVYSLGVVCAELFLDFGTAMERAAVLERLQHAEPRDSRGVTVGGPPLPPASDASSHTVAEVEALVRSMLARDATARPTLAAVEQAAAARS